MICSVCKQERDCRMRVDSGAYGPVDVQTCRECHEKDQADVRAESKRLGFRLKLQRWEKLTTDGTFSSCR